MLAVAPALLAIGCVQSQRGQVFRDDSKARFSSLLIANTLAASTDITAALPDGSSCRGRIARTQASESENPDAPESEEALGVLLCRETSLHCRLTYVFPRGFVWGRCTDPKGLGYRVRFRGGR